MRQYLFALVGGAAAFCILAQPTAPAAAQQACQRPAAPAIPDAPAWDMALAEVAAAHDARDRYVAAADRYRTCLDQEIEARLAAMARSGAQDDPALFAAGAAHRVISEERVDIYGRFVLMCLRWEDQTRTTYPRGCQTPPP